MNDDPELAAELDDAEDVVIRGSWTETEWGVRYNYPAGSHVVNFSGDDEGAAREAKRKPAPDQVLTLVRRTVTYGPWEEVPG